jgi:hypothetical protein
MDESLRWLLVNAGQITVAGLLAAFLVTGIVALQRKWVVPGWLYQECIADRDRFEQKVEAMALANEEKIARLEARLDGLSGGRMR